MTGHLCARKFIVHSLVSSCDTMLDSLVSLIFEISFTQRILESNVAKTLMDDKNLKPWYLSLD